MCADCTGSQSVCAHTTHVFSLLRMQQVVHVYGGEEGESEALESPPQKETSELHGRGSEPICLSVSVTV